MSGWLNDDTGRHTFTVETVGGGSATPVTYSTSIKKFGSSSAKFVRTSDTIASFLKTANHSDFNLGSDNFSINFWVYPQYQSGEVHGIMTNWENLSIDTGWNIQFRSNETYPRMQFSSGYDAGSGLTGNQTAYTCPDSQWSHVAISRDDSFSPRKYRMWINGRLVYNYGSATGYFGYGFRNTSAPFWIGARDDSGQTTPIEYFNGYLDGLHIERGVSNWSGETTGTVYFDHNALTAPTETAYSILLMNFNETLYEVNGDLSHDARIIVIDETTGEIDSDSVETAGSYSLTVNDNNEKTVVAVRESDGESLSYGRVIPTTV